MEGAFVDGVLCIIGVPLGRYVLQLNNYLVKVRLFEINGNSVTLPFESGYCIHGILRSIINGH